MNDASAFATKESAVRLVWAASLASANEVAAPSPPPPAAFAIDHCDPTNCTATAARVVVPVDARSNATAAGVTSRVVTYDLAVVGVHAHRVAFRLVSISAAGVASAASLGPVLPFNVGARANVTFVSPSPSSPSNSSSFGEAACGKWSAPCESLSAALAAAATSSSSVLDVVMLPGTHPSIGSCGVDLGTTRPTTVTAVPGLTPDVTVIDCGSAPLTTNGVTSYPGGLIMSGPHHVSVSGLTVFNATGATGGGLLVYGPKASVTVTDVVIDRCRAMSMGGGVHVKLGAAVTLARVTVVGCSGGNDQTGNHNRGGGIYVEDTATSVTMTDITISENSLDVSGKGGGLNVDNGASVNASGLVVTNNSAFFAAGIFIGKGCTTNISRANITGNKADYGAGVGIFDGANPLIIDSVISSNAASKWGGGLLVYTGATATLRQVAFQQNMAELGGGAVAYTRSSFTVLHSTFVANSASVSGGALHLQTLSSVALVETNVEGNIAAMGGGGAHITSGASLSITGGAITGNEASQSGGGIFCQGGAHGGGNLTMTAGVAVVGNACGTFGGGVHLTGGCLARFSTKVEFANNSAGSTSGAGAMCPNPGDSGGGAVAVEPHKGHVTTLVTEGCSFMNNVAPDGGGIFVTDKCEDATAECRKTGAEVHLKSTLVGGNKAVGCRNHESSAAVGTCVSKGQRGSGGGVSAASGIISLTDGTSVKNNFATADGGGVHVHGMASLNIAGRTTHVVGNVANETGGGVMHAGHRLSITGTASFTRNGATDGGAVAIAITTTAKSDESFSFKITGNVTLAHNVATRRGGGVYLSAPMVRGNLSGIILSNSSATAGPGLYWVRAASPDLPLDCTGCSVRSGSSNRSVFEVSATEALSLSFRVSPALELHSGVVAPLFSLNLVDFYGRVAPTEDGVVCRLEAVSQASAPAVGSFVGATTFSAASNAIAGDILEVSGAVTATSLAGLVSFDRVLVRGRLGGVYHSSIRCQRTGTATGGETTPSITAPTMPSISSADFESNGTSSSSSASKMGTIQELVFPLKMAHCLPGNEPLVVSVDPLGAAVAKECSPCKDRSFNFDGVSCKPCPLGGECLGGDRLESRAGWWRSSDSAEIFFACSLAEACGSGNATADAACAPGYHGPTCGVCMPGYRRWGSACVTCGKTSTYMLPLFGALGFSVFISYIFTVPARDSANKACLFSSLLFVAQCLGLLKDYDVIFPSGIDRVIDTLNLANFNLAALAPGCTDTDVNFYRNFIVAIAVPPAIVVLCVGVYLFAEVSRRARGHDSNGHESVCEEMKRRCMRNAVWLMVLAYSGVAKTVLQLYNVRRLDVGYYLRRDYSINADDHSYRAYAAIGYVALVLYPIGIPLGIAWILTSGARSENLDDTDFKAKFGFLYGMYRREFVAWELVGLLTKFVLAAIPVFATERNLRHHGVSTLELDYGAGSGYALACQASFAQTACLVLLVCVIWLRPHRNTLHSTQQATAAAIVLGWTLILGGVLNLPANADNSSPMASTGGFTNEERVAVCLSAVAATAAAVAAMIRWSAVTGELDDFSARRASDAIKEMYRRVSMSFSKTYLYNLAKRNASVAAKPSAQQIHEQDEVLDETEAARNHALRPMPRCDKFKGEVFSFEDQLRFLSSPQQLVVECEVRPEDDLKPSKT